MAQTTSGTSATGHLRRFWWLKRLSVAGAVLAIGLLALRLWWGGHAARLLAAEQDLLRRAGHPVSVEELNAPPIAAEQNAATFLNRAMALHKRNLGPSASSFTFPEYPPFPPKWHQLAEADAATNAAVFAPLRQARAHDEADWGIRFRSPLLMVMLPTLNQLRGLANFAGDAALREHLRGNDAAALELVRDVRHVARAADRQPFLVSHLVATGCEALALDRLQVIASDLRVTEGGDFSVGAPIPDGPATRGQVMALIGELLQPRQPGVGPSPAMVTERLLQADMIRWATRGNWVLRPLFQTEERRVLVNSRWYEAAAAQQTWNGLRSVFASRPPQRPRRGPARVVTALSTAVTPSLDRAFELDLRTILERRMTAVSLAAQLYRADHGKWPASLDELAPRYLPVVPADPYAPAREPLRYVLATGVLPGGADRPVVYSVYQNQSDDTAPGYAPLPPAPQYGWSNDVDQRRDLSRWQPPARNVTAAPPGPPGATPDSDDAEDEDVERSPDAVDDDPDEPDDPGDGEQRQRR